MQNDQVLHRGPAARAYDHVRNLLLSGRLAPGTRLVTRKLAADTGTSLNPVREALGRLASEGVVDHIPGAGAFVRRLGRRELEEIFGMREALESYAAEHAAIHITEDELEELQGICDSWLHLARQLRANKSGRPFSPSKEFVSNWVDNTEAFHSLLVEAARNTLLTKTVAKFRLQQAVFGIYRQLPPVELHDAARNWLSHSRLVRALRKRNGVLAASIVRAQMRVGRRLMLSQLRREETE